METKRFIYYEEDGFLVGWLEDYPDYRTQGETMEQLQDNLLDVYKELVSGEIPRVRPCRTLRRTRIRRRVDGSRDWPVLPSRD